MMWTGEKTYTVSGKNGETKAKEVKWFGFHLHLIADANYELPVAFTVTKARRINPSGETKKQLEKMKQEHPERLEKCKHFIGDKGYDSSKLIKMLEDNDIMPIIDIRNCWKGEDLTCQNRDTDLVYDYQGNVWCVKDDGNLEKLLYRGHDKGTDSLRYGFHPRMKDKRVFRNKCDEDRRIFISIARDSKKWKRLYNKRSGIERINGRIDRDYKFEKYTVRGLAKMDMFITVTLIVYLGMAKAKVERGVTEHLGRLYA